MMSYSGLLAAFVVLLSTTAIFMRKLDRDSNGLLKVMVLVLVVLGLGVVAFFVGLAFAVMSYGSSK